MGWQGKKTQIQNNEKDNQGMSWDSYATSKDTMHKRHW
jgi:hypothetical protein